jgi:hypothetical protein
MLHLDSLAYVTLCHKLGHITFHTSPPILVSQAYIHLYGSRVDGVGRIVGLIHDGVSKMALLRYTQPLLKP